ncbi:tripartite motif-containing protein 5-like [Phyllostomus discolor]|uniref:Tripartite motif-containing protein 5-like n=1 Tax=Phyllostomus discolor TaxID=89673 RepID=A0A6J2LYT6_9CHIR|nr:tripartite motif-containing protein 5-like [Phyllostomus discolor]XP_035886080.1 tripartite motif-containing protein 5-like [Phyllostomus discolor]XP_035886081.1 tripartite motif-containing protein 5-like [Phyllostomus discolor]XP_035886082.1 tripartite motif-containing protein 5-like [Phyllostomus discolor]XP_035886083.1 tripartite motif-containing protein 5-like [Phyllostomus discolor]
MASGILLNMKEEVTCPICLELLTEPLSLDCGHTFCQACITANNTESMVSEEGGSSCPVCRIRYQPGNLRPNRHVANIVEMLQNVKLSLEEEQKTDLCERHGEKLLLFCKEDGKFICWLCERSQEHRDHHTLLTEEVAQEYKEKLQAALNRLRAEQQQVKKFGADIREERTSWENQIKSEVQSAQDCFKKLRDILYNKEQEEVRKLEKEKIYIFHVLEQSESEQVQQSLLLRDLISELELRLQGSTMKMLQDVNGILESSQTFTLKRPKILSKEQRRVFRVPDLNGMLQVFDELTDVRRYWDHITLDPPKDRRNVAISADLRQVRYEYHCDPQVQRGFPCNIGINQENRFHQASNYGVVGVPSITSGKHYWEVDVSDKRTWMLGVCSEKSPSLNLLHELNGMFVDRKVQRYQTFNIGIPSTLTGPVTTRTGGGYWVIHLEERCIYNALAKSSFCNLFKVALSLTVPPRRVGVFLDYDARTVSFYNVTNHGFLIYKFPSCSFSQEMYPYFCPMTCTVPMTLCSPSS